MNLLTQLQIIVDSGLFFLIWLVQLIIYPSFRYTEEHHFINWHKRYTTLISLFAVPLMIIQAGIEAILMPYGARWLRILLIISAWAATISLSVPCHKKLQHGKDMSIINMLVASNWIRTVLWSAVFFETARSVFNQYM